jgi:hypothetical protein
MLGRMCNDLPVAQVLHTAQQDRRPKWSISPMSYSQPRYSRSRSAFPYSRYGETTMRKGTRRVTKDAIVVASDLRAGLMAAIVLIGCETLGYIVAVVVAAVIYIAPLDSIADAVSRATDDTDSTATDTDSYDTDTDSYDGEEN